MRLLWWLRTCAALQLLLAPPSKLWLKQEILNQMVLLPNNIPTLLQLLTDPIHSGRYEKFFLAWCAAASPMEYLQFAREVIGNLENIPIGRLLISWDCWERTHSAEDDYFQVVPMPSRWLFDEMPYSPSMASRLPWSDQLEAVERSSLLPNPRVPLQMLLETQQFSLIEPAQANPFILTEMRSTMNIQDSLHAWWIEWMIKGRTGIVDFSGLRLAEIKTMRVKLELLCWQLEYGRVIVDDFADLLQSLYEQPLMIPSLQFAAVLRAAKGTFALSTLLTHLHFNAQLALRVAPVLTPSQWLSLPFATRILALRQHCIERHDPNNNTYHDETFAKHSDESFWFIQRIMRLNEDRDDWTDWERYDYPRLARLLQPFLYWEGRPRSIIHPLLLTAASRLTLLAITLNLDDVLINLPADFLWQLEAGIVNPLKPISDLKQLSEVSQSQFYLSNTINPMGSLWQIHTVITERLRFSSGQYLHHRSDNHIFTIDASRVAMQSWRAWKNWWAQLKEQLEPFLTIDEIIGLFS